MSSKRRRRRRECERKHHLSQAAAMREAARLSARSGERVSAYPCQFGAHWHIGHTPKRVRQAVAAKARAGG